MWFYYPVLPSLAWLMLLVTEENCTKSSLDQLTDTKKILEHDARVLGIGWEEFDGLSFNSPEFIDTVCIDEFLFQGRVM